MSLPLTDTLFWLAVAACAIAQVAIVRASVAPPSASPHAAGMPARARRAELVWVILPALLLALTLVLTWRALGHGRLVPAPPGIAPPHAGHGGAT